MQFDFSSVVNVAIIIGGMIVGVVWLKSALVKQRHEELESLADTRGQRIDDLESEVKKLRDELSNLRGQVTAIQTLKATEIAELVSARLSLALKPI